MNEEPIMQPAERPAQPQPVIETPAPIPGPKKKKKIAVFIVVTVALVAMGVGAYLLFGRPESTRQNSQEADVSQNQPQPEEKSTELKPETITDKIEKTYASRYKVVANGPGEGPKEGEIAITTFKTSPPYKVDGYVYYTDYKGGSTLEFATHNPDPDKTTLPTNSTKALRTEIAAIYEDMGLEKVSSYGSVDGGNLTNVYIGAGVTCIIQDPSTGSSGTSASCGLIKSYEKAAADIKPLADVIPGIDKDTYLGGLKIENSKISGYQRASLGQGSVGGGGSAVLLYKKGDGPWIYFRNTQMIMPCSQFNTTDLKNAFKGEKCLDAKDQLITL